MNRNHDYRALRDQFVASDTIGIRALCKANDIENFSPVFERARIEGWRDLRLQRQQQANDKTLTIIADDQALERAKAVVVVDKAFDVILAAFDKMLADMSRTHEKQIGTGDNAKFVEEPVMILMPADFAILVDKMNVLLGRPDFVSEERTLGLNFSNDNVPVDILQAIAEYARGEADGGAAPDSGLPRSEGASQEA